MKKKAIIVIIILALIVGAIVAAPTLIKQSRVDSLAAEIRTDVISILDNESITDYTISDDTIQEGYNDYCISLDIPSLENMDEQSKLSLLRQICDKNDGFFPGKATSTSEFVHVKVKVISNGNRYYAFDRYTYYINDDPVSVNPYPDDYGNYDKNDPYYSGNDHNNDGYIDGNEFQDAVGDWMDKHGY